jgi:hypothetical protein
MMRRNVGSQGFRAVVRRSKLQRSNHEIDTPRIAMPHRRQHARYLSTTTLTKLATIVFSVFLYSLSAHGQILSFSPGDPAESSGEAFAPYLAPAKFGPATISEENLTNDGTEVTTSSVTGESAEPMPSAPDPALNGNPEHYAVPYAGDWHQEKFSRIGIGADLSPLGLGIESAIVLDEYFDARLRMDFFGLTINRVEFDGVNVSGNVHFASGTASVDAYPWNSVWRISGGLMLFNGNQVNAQTRIAGGTSFKLNSVTYYSYNGDEVTGTGVVGFNTVKPAPMVSFGFGKYIPRSNRHWSFPTEFGIVYTGAPSIKVNVAGTACTDKAQSHCSNVADESNPVGLAVNKNLQARLSGLQLQYQVRVSCPESNWAKDAQS